MAGGIERRTLGQWFSAGSSPVTRRHWQCLEMFLVCRDLGRDLCGVGFLIFSKGYWEG